MTVGPWQRLMRQLLGRRRSPVNVPCVSRDPARALRTCAYAGLISPGLRPSAAISAKDRRLTACILRSSSSGMAKCFPVASVALWASAIATLKYWKDGAPNLTGPIHRPVGADGAGSAGTVTWITQPAGGALSVMLAQLQCAAVSCQERRNGTFHESVHPRHSLYSLWPSSSGNGDGAAYGIEVTRFSWLAFFCLLCISSPVFGFSLGSPWSFVDAHCRAEASWRAPAAADPTIRPNLLPLALLLSMTHLAVWVPSL
jgi:hypothetical protein